MKVGACINRMLLNDSDVTTMVGTRIYPERAPEGAAAPFIVYSVVSNQTSDSKNGTPIDEAQLEVFSGDAQRAPVLRSLNEKELATAQFGAGH